MTWLETLNDFNIISVIVRVFLAMLLGGCIGLEREKSKRPAGFRTHILVCVGSCMTALIGLYVVYEMGASSDPVRIAAQVISGIGFLGVGTILVKEHDHITGLTTAAGLWTTAAIGIACGYGFYIGALLGTLVVAITSAILFKLEGRGRKKNRKVTMYIEINSLDCLNEYIDWINDTYKARCITVVAPRSAVTGNVGLEAVLPVVGNEDMKAVLETVRAKEYVVFAMESVKREK